MLGNEALVPLAEAEMLGNEGLVPFFKAKIAKTYFVSTAGHSKDLSATGMSEMAGNFFWQNSLQVPLAGVPLNSRAIQLLVDRNFAEPCPFPMNMVVAFPFGTSGTSREFPEAPGKSDSLPQTQARKRHININSEKTQSTQTAKFDPTSSLTKVLTKMHTKMSTETPTTFEDFCVKRATGSPRRLPRVCSREI